MTRPSTPELARRIVDRVIDTLDKHDFGIRDNYEDEDDREEVLKDLHDAVEEALKDR